MALYLSEALSNELQDGLTFVDVEVMAGPLDLSYSCVWEFIRVYLVWVLHTKTTVQEVGGAGVLCVHAPWVTNDIIEVSHDGVHVDRPLNCLMVVSLRVD